MEIFVLASGSKGNATVFSKDNIWYMIDCGISITKLKEKLTKLNISLKAISKLFITHEHRDHILGLKPFLKYGDLKDVYLTQGTYEAIKDILNEFKHLKIHIVVQDVLFVVDDFHVTPIMLSHDANEPVGFIYQIENKKFVLLTDTGYVHESYIPLIKGADLYLLESNHDPVILMNSARPFMLKKRILGQHGHLSNVDACTLMNRLLENIEKTIWVVSHISEDCNTILSIEKDIVKYIDDPTKIEVLYSSQESLPVIKL